MIPASWEECLIEKRFNYCKNRQLSYMTHSLDIMRLLALESTFAWYFSQKVELFPEKNGELNLNSI